MMRFNPNVMLRPQGDADLDGTPPPAGVPVPANNVRMTNPAGQSMQIGAPMAPNMGPRIEEEGTVFDGDGNPVGSSTYNVTAPPGSNTPGSAVGFERGIYDGFMGTGESQTLNEWGVDGKFANELWSDPGAFLELWSDNTGLSKTGLESGDINAAQDFYTLSGLTKGGVGDMADFQNQYLQNMSGQGTGNYLTMTDVMSMVFGSEGEMLDAYLMSYDQNGDPANMDDQAGLLNSMMIGAISNSVPPQFQQAYASYLNQQSLEWRAATMQGGYDGTYRQYLVDNGAAQVLGGVQ